MTQDKTFQWFSLGTVWLWLIIFALIPSALVFITSLLSQGDAELIRLQLTFKNYKDFFNPIYLKIFLNSFILASACTITCLILAYPFAYIVARMPAHHKGLLLILVIIPFWTSSLIRSYAIVAILKTHGILNSLLLWSGIISQPLQLMYTSTAVLIGLTYSLLPFMILPLYANIEKLDTRLIDAARDLGAKNFQIFFRVLLPLSLPGILAGSILVFLPAMTLFYIPDLLGGAKNLLLGNLIQNQFLSARNWPMGSTVSVVLTVLMGIMLLIYWRSTKNNRTGPGFAMTRFPRIAYLTVIYLFFYIPIGVLIVYSFNDARYSLLWQGFTLDWYYALLENTDIQVAALHSLVIGVLAATFATAIGTLTAASLYRYQFHGKQLLHATLFILIVSPDIVMGISLLILFSTLNAPLGFWTLLLAHITFCLPFVTVTIYSRLTSIDKNIFEAAKDVGATEFTIFTRILIPLLWPAILAGWLLSFTLSLDDVLISFFVTGPEFEILPLKIFSMVRLGVKPEVNALCSIMFVLTLFLVLIAQFALRKKR